MRLRFCGLSIGLHIKRLNSVLSTRCRAKVLLCVFPAVYDLHFQHYFINRDYYITVIRILQLKKNRFFTEFPRKILKFYHTGKKNKRSALLGGTSYLLFSFFSDFSSAFLPEFVTCQLIPIKIFSPIIGKAL